MMSEFGLGRLVPQDWEHVNKYALSAVVPHTVDHVEKTLKLQYGYRKKYDQENEGACVGFASSWMMSILNRRFYKAKWLWDQAKTVDQWPYTNPGDGKGTSVRAAMDILRDVGHIRIFRNREYPPEIKEGIKENRWAKTVDEVRTVISKNVPVVIGINWYVNFDNPQKEGRCHWIGKGNLGAVRGGHAVCIYRASDKLQAVGIVNSWGRRYPLVMMSYDILQKLLDEDGEATMVTDRI